MTTLSALSPVPSAPAVALAFIFSSPPVLSCSFFFFFLNILILLWGRGLLNGQDHF